MEREALKEEVQELLQLTHLLQEHGRKEQAEAIRVHAEDAIIELLWLLKQDIEKGSGGA